MARPRKSLISLNNTPYYHCVSRCVRRAFLCGQDHYSGKSYEHRRAWVENRLLKLASAFSIDICAYAVMNNHTHVVLHVDENKAKSWSPEEVLQRWHKLHKGTLLTHQFLDQQKRMYMSKAHIETVLATVKTYRKRLIDISWFMRLLNEYIARRANKEDECTGRFWEGRFKSQALLDEAALIACMAYVDLNPVRAGMARKAKQAAYTSIKRRIFAARQGKQPHLLFPFRGSGYSKSRKGLPFNLKDYFNLINQKCSYLTSDCDRKKGNVCTPILEDTGLSNVDWSLMINRIETHFTTAISLPLAERRLLK